MPATKEATTGVQLRRFTRDEYHALAEAGILKPDEQVAPSAFANARLLLSDIL